MRRLPSPSALALAVVLAAGSAPSAAQAPRAAATAPAAGGVAWSSLSAAQARVLAPLAGVWTTLDDEQQRRWVELAARYPRMSSHDQRLLQERMTLWAAMSAAERRRARVQFQQASALSADERLSQWEAYRALPPDERRRLTEQAQRSEAAAAAPPRPSAAGKSTIVDPLPTVTERAVAAATVQAAPGATTRPITRDAEPPRHQQAGMPKIVATPDFVDRSTLLPRRGAQAAPVREPASAPQRAEPRR